MSRADPLMASPSPTTPGASGAPHQTCGTVATKQGCCCNACGRGAQPHGLRLRGGALAVGSIVGIACWAFLYVLGALGYALGGGRTLGCGGWAAWALGVYGAGAAAAALAAGAWVAGRCGGTTCRAAGLLYGVVMAGMANITLVATTALLLPALGAGYEGPFATVLAVGAAAVGFEAGPVASRAAMLGTMALAFLLGAWGGRHGVLARGRAAR